jgi:hypothetical protein
MAGRAGGAARGALAGILLLLGACRAPAPAPAPARPQGSAATGPARPQGNAPKPQFTFSPWSRAVPLITQGRVVQVVSGHGGWSLILDDHTWVHLVPDPADPLPRNIMDFIARKAPNARSIKQTKE